MSAGRDDAMAGFESEDATVGCRDADGSPKSLQSSVESVSARVDGAGDVWGRGPVS